MLKRRDACWVNAAYISVFRKSETLFRWLIMVWKKVLTTPTVNQHKMFSNMPIGTSCTSVTSSCKADDLPAIAAETYSRCLWIITMKQITLWMTSSSQAKWASTERQPLGCNATVHAPSAQGSVLLQPQKQTIWILSHCLTFEHLNRKPHAYSIQKQNKQQ